MRTQPAKQPSRKRDADVRSNAESAQTRARPSNGVVHDAAGVGDTAQHEQFIDVAAVWVKPSTLHPWSQNPTKDDPASVRRVADSIKRFGFGAPLVARRANSEVIAGHTRLRAAKQLGLELVPVRYLDISEADAHALALADNRLAELTLRNAGLLAEVLQSMPSVDQLVAGYKQADIDQMIETLAAKQPQPVDESPRLDRPGEYKVCPNCGQQLAAQ